MTAAMAAQRDRTSEFQNLVVKRCKGRGEDSVDELSVRVRSSQILRPARGVKSEFAKAVEGVGSLISALRRVLTESRCWRAERPTRGPDYRVHSSMQAEH